MSSLFRGERPDLVSFSPRLSVSAWRLMSLPPAETGPAGARPRALGGLRAGAGGAVGRAVAVGGSELSRRSLGM